MTILITRPAVVLALVAGLALAGCAAPPPVRLARTTVVLLPDEDGNVGAVSLGTAGGIRKLEHAYTSASVEGLQAQPSETSALGRESVVATYDKLLQAQPPKPRSFILNFLFDKTVLTEDSKAMIPAVLAAIRERKPTEITIFGHADATGSEKRNVKLSEQRAKVVAALLRKADPELDRIEVQYFGDKAPMVHSESGPEPRNRRAEVMVL